MRRILVRFLQVLVLEFLVVFAVCAQPLQTRAADYGTTKKKMATVALFGLGGAGLGLVTVAAASDPQSRLGNIPAGMVVGAIIGTVYVFTADGPRGSAWLEPTENGMQMRVAYRF